MRECDANVAKMEKSGNMADRPTFPAKRSVVEGEKNAGRRCGKEWREVRRRQVGGREEDYGVGVESSVTPALCRQHSTPACLECLESASTTQQHLHPRETDENEISDSLQ
ncbi:hypothetical protein O3P69_001538 [Scylla paramamosain]|uniref:Uncharacterized protein n=1 Tax=Scylla paramamosain TaxID=85552 RepID=A0AAW0V0Q6_SCYPA